MKTFPNFSFAKYTLVPLIPVAVVYAFWGAAAAAIICAIFYWGVFAILASAFLLVTFSQRRRAEKTTFMQAYINGLREKGVKTNTQIVINTAFLFGYLWLLLSQGFVITVFMVLCLECFIYSGVFLSRHPEV